MSGEPSPKRERSPAFMMRVVAVGLVIEIVLLGLLTRGCS